MAGKSLYLWYWELNENMPTAERLKVAKELTSSGLFPPEGVNVLRFDITPEYWGITIFEADNIEDVFKTINIWRAAKEGFFTTVKVSPAMPVKEVLPLNASILESLKKARA